MVNIGKTININETITGKKIGFPKGGKGSTSCRIGLPKSWLESLGITEENPHVKVTYQDGKIIIEKE